MWYVIQVAGGQEENTAALLRRRISLEIMKECFIPRKERIKKFKGSWKKTEEILFPGYVFAVTEEPEKLFLQLKSVARLTKLLQDGVYYFIPLTEEEEELICSIGDNYHVTRLSRVKIKRLSEFSGDGTEAYAERHAGNGDDTGERKSKKVVILDGPLKSQEGRIAGYNLHKREVTVRIPFMGKEVDLKLGLELVREKE